MCSHPTYLVPATYYEESSPWRALHSEDFPHLLIPAGQAGTCLWPPGFSSSSFSRRHACMAGPGPDLCNEVRIAVKEGVIFLLVEGLAFGLYKMPHL